MRKRSKDQYQATLQLDQVVWDGGNIRARKEVTRATSEVDKQKLEVDMYAINERVNQLFFGILLLKEQLKQNQLMQEELQRNYDNVAAYVKNGIANQADLDAVKVEQLNNIQQRHTLEATYRAYGEMLKIMINHPTPLTENTLKKPDVNALLYKGEAYSTEFIRRPELNLFAVQNQQLEAQRKQLTAKNLPRLDLFVQGAYGNPGLNMLKNEFSAYYVAGVRLSWNFGNLYTRKNESRQLILNQQDVNVQKETFLFNTHLEITQNNSEIKKLTELMKNDEEIITLRNNIKKSKLKVHSKKQKSSKIIMRYFIFFGYDGTNYHGWQIQPNANSVQQELQRALSILLRKDMEVVGAGRTDTGVHARHMAAHFDTDRIPMEPDQLVYRLNRILPRDIAVYEVREVAPEMHARFSAISRTYHYYIHTRKDPFERHYSLQMNYPLNFEKMNEAAQHFLHHEDYAAFCKAGGDNKTTICHVTAARWIQTSPTTWYFEITANRFLRNMVRAVVGTLIDVGREKITMEQFLDILHNGSRSDAGESMPGNALFLEEVGYDFKD